MTFTKQAVTTLGRTALRNAGKSATQQFEQKGAQFLENNLHGGVSNFNFKTSDALSGAAKDLVGTLVSAYTPGKTSLGVGAAAFLAGASQSKTSTEQNTLLQADTSLKEPGRVTGGSEIAVSPDQAKDALSDVNSLVKQAAKAAAAVKGTIDIGSVSGIENPASKAINTILTPALVGFNSGQAFVGAEKPASIPASVASAAGYAMGFNDKAEIVSAEKAAGEVAKKTAPAAKKLLIRQGAASDATSKTVKNEYSPADQLGYALNNAEKISQSVQQKAEKVGSSLGKATDEALKGMGKIARDAGLANNRVTTMPSKNILDAVSKKPSVIKTNMGALKSFQQEGKSGVSAPNAASQNQDAGKER